MWNDNISDIILNNYMDYALKEREQYIVDPGREIQGGERAMCILLDLPMSISSVMEIYTDTPWDVAKKLATIYYEKTKNVFTHVSKSFYNREYHVYAGPRVVCKVFIESTAKNTAISKTHEGTEQFFISPKLQLIDLMHKLYNPADFDARNETLRLVKLIMENYHMDLGGNEAIAGNDWQAIDEFFHDKVIVYASRSHIIMISDKTHEDDTKAITRKLGYECNVHNVRLPKDFFIKKLTFHTGRPHGKRGGADDDETDNVSFEQIDGGGSDDPNNILFAGNVISGLNMFIDSISEVMIPLAMIGAGEIEGGRRKHQSPRHEMRRNSQKNPQQNTKYSIYNIGSYEIIPYRNIMLGKHRIKIATSAVRARILLTEDNTMHNLHASGIIKSPIYLTTKAIINSAITEEYPLPFDETDETGFFGITQKQNVMRKKLLADEKRVQPFFPAFASGVSTDSKTP